jgi:hypothetical protein
MADQMNRPAVDRMNGPAVLDKQAGGASSVDMYGVSGLSGWHRHSYEAGFPGLCMAAYLFE